MELFLVLLVEGTRIHLTPETIRGAYGVLQSKAKTELTNNNRQVQEILF